MAEKPARIFIANLAHLAVFDPNGDQVGRVLDVVVALRVGREPPIVRGVVLDIQRRHIFVPMGRVRSIDADALVLSTARVNLRQFDKRPDETLALAELLDRRVSVLETGATATVVDIAIERTRTKDWVVSRVAVVEGRRRGQLHILEWDEVSGFALPEEQQGAANMLAAFEKLPPADLAAYLHALPEKRRREVAAALDDERLADVLEELPEDDQVEILGALAGERAADVLEAMAPDDAADLLGELPTPEAERLLELMEPDEAGPVRRLLTYADDTAGGMMTSEPIVLPPTATVAEALARVREPEVSPALAAQVYVCRPPTETPTGQYLGIGHIQRLLREPPSALVTGVIDTDITPLKPDCPLNDVTHYLATYNLVAVPVIDDDGHLIGAVTVDDVLDHLLPKDWREQPVMESARGS